MLLLNAVLTVEEGRAGAHQGKGWEGFTDHVVETLNREREDLVFMLWGSYAQAKGKVIDTAPAPRAEGAASLAAVGAPRLHRLRAFLGRQPLSGAARARRRSTGACRPKPN